MVDDEDADDFNPYTPETAADVARAGDALVAALRRHVELVQAARRHSDSPAIFQAGHELLTAVMAYVDAQFEHTGTAYPLGALQELVDDEEDEDEDEDDDDIGSSGPTSRVTILRRADFGVASEEAVMRAGRTAYRELWPDEDQQAAAAHVTHIGSALYEIAHARGWEALAETDGLLPAGGANVVMRPTELLGPDPDDWPDELFNPDGDQLFRQDDVWG